MNTPLYRYLSTEAFLYFLQFSGLYVSKVTDWPDSYEGTRFEFLRKARNSELSDVTKDNFYASCWTLQTEERCLFADDESFLKAEEELSKDGSALMWGSYCGKGGVRIKTTLGKLENLLASRLQDCKIYRGKVYYEPAYSWGKMPKPGCLVSTLLHKRVSFRSESEYRFLILPDNSIKDFISTAFIEDLFEFLDEILIAPATSSNKWIARALYKVATKVSIDPPRIKNTNVKGGHPFCRISQLYASVSAL